MSGSQHRIPIDLTRYTEATRRALYDAVAAIHFFRTPEDPEDFIPDYSPDDAGLTILYLGNHWLALWEVVEERDNPDLAPEFRYSLLSIGADPSAPGGIAFCEV